MYLKKNPSSMHSACNGSHSGRRLLHLPSTASLAPHGENQVSVINYVGKGKRRPIKECFVCIYMTER